MSAAPVKSQTHAGSNPADGAKQLINTAMGKRENVTITTNRLVTKRTVTPILKTTNAPNDRNEWWHRWNLDYIEPSKR